MKELTAEIAYDLLKIIPENSFITSSYSNGIDKCCATGHLRRVLSNNPSNYDVNYLLEGEWDIVVSRFNKILHTTMGYSLTVINDQSLCGISEGIKEKYPQSTPRQRVLTFLEDAMLIGL